MWRQWLILWLMKLNKGFPWKSMHGRLNHSHYLWRLKHDSGWPVLRTKIVHASSVLFKSCKEFFTSRRGLFCFLEYYISLSTYQWKQWHFHIRDVNAALGHRTHFLQGVDEQAGGRKRAAASQAAQLNQSCLTGSQDSARPLLSLCGQLEEDLMRKEERKRNDVIALTVSLSRFIWIFIVTHGTYIFY